MALVGEMLSASVFSIIGKILIFVFIFIIGPYMIYQYISIQAKNREIASLKVQLSACIENVDDMDNITSKTEKSYEEMIAKYGKRIEEMCKEIIKNTDEELTEERILRLFKKGEEKK